jgi:ubiquinone/menaquinone biosynthesis C-methylase UbiE
VPETEETTAGAAHAEAYDEMQALLYEKGWLETDDLLSTGIVSGNALEIGSGPGYLGLHWLEKTVDTRLTGLDNSEAMVSIAHRNAAERGLAHRVHYVCGSADAAPFEAETFDAVFSSRSLHEWADPLATLRQIWRLLRPGGRVYLCDLRRDLSSKAQRFLIRRMPSASVSKGLLASIRAAYTVEEVTAWLDKTPCRDFEVVRLPLGLRITGAKPAGREKI